MSKIHKNKPLSEEHKKKIGEKRKGIVFSDETLIKMSNAQKGEKSHRAKSVQYVETGEIFWGATAFKKKYGFDTGHLIRAVEVSAKLLMDIIGNMQRRCHNATKQKDVRMYSTYGIYRFKKG